MTPLLADILAGILGWGSLTAALIWAFHRLHHRDPGEPLDLTGHRWRS